MRCELVYNELYIKYLHLHTIDSVILSIWQVPEVGKSPIRTPTLGKRV